MKGSVNKQIGFIVKQINGIGTSKRDARSYSNTYAQNNQKVSNKIHSAKYLNDAKNTYKQLAEYIKNTTNEKLNMEKISNEQIKDFIQTKIVANNNYRSISTQISHLEKLRIAVNEISKLKGKENQGFDRSGLIKTRDYAKENSLKTVHMNRSFINPKEVISNLKNETKIVAQIQQVVGLRAREASNLKQQNLLGNNTISVQGKGGYIIEKELSPLLYQKIENIINLKGEFKVPYSTYSKELKLAALKAGEINISSHSFRYSYAQEQFDKYKDEGFSKEQCYLKVSEDLGHHRGEIVKNVYLK